MIAVDTHVLLWLDQQDKRLGKKTEALIEKAQDKGLVYVSAVVFLEVGTLLRKGRIQMRMALSTWRKTLLQAGLNELPMTGDIALLAAGLQDFHPDPADRLHVATALSHGLTFLTADEAILGWKHVQLQCFNAQR